MGSTTGDTGHTGENKQGLPILPRAPRGSNPYTHLKTDLVDLLCHQAGAHTMTIEIPNPSLVLLIGSSGAGKSTFAARHFLPTEVVSSDRCRAMICDDESDQTINSETFGLLHHIARLRLQQQRLTVIDATNLQFRSRRPLLRMARAHRVPIIAIVFRLPLESCLANNQSRLERRVSQEVLALHQLQLADTLSRLDREAYSQIYVIEKSDLANLVVSKLSLNSDAA